MFDGISCGQLALQRLGISYNQYFASEVDKKAIQITQSRFPNTIQIGDVTKVQGKDLPKIDVLWGGFPCQSFSLAGKQLNFNDPRGQLFFECVRLLKEINPKYFLFENTKMKKEYQDAISQQLGVKPILLNSALVSGQNRERLFWTNVPFEVPQNRNINIKDILDVKIEDKLFLSRDINDIKGYIPKTSKSNYLRKLGYIKFDSAGYRVYSIEGRSHTLTSLNGGLAGNANVLISDGTYVRKINATEAERLQTLPDKYTEGVSETARRKAIGNGWTVDVIVEILKGIK